MKHSFLFQALRFILGAFFFSVVTLCNATPLKMTNEEKCLTIAIFEEARGEGERGMQAVAQVILNRKASKRYPPTVCGVIKQHKQFSFYNPDQRNTKKLKALYNQDLRGFSSKDRVVYIQAKIIASSALYEMSKEIPELRESLFFKRKDLKPKWSLKMKRKLSIGNHTFY